MEVLAATVREVGLSSGLDVVGITDAGPFLSARHDLEERKSKGLHAGMCFTFGSPERSTDPGISLPGARSLIVGARFYGDRGGMQPRHGHCGVDESGKSGDPMALGGGEPSASGRVAQYSWRDQYSLVRRGLTCIGEALSASGYTGLVLVDDNRLVDKPAAVRAGIGFFGKNTLLLVPGRGSRFVIGSVVTDAALPLDEQRVDRGCGSCTRCMTACPTGALIAPGVLDARRCLAWLLQAPGPFPLEHRAALERRVYGCDACQDACPVNRRADRDDGQVAVSRDAAQVADRGDEQVVDLEWIIGASDEEILARFSRWYIPRRQARYVRRNALVALGNSHGAPSRVTGRALLRALADPDPLIQEHAVWAARRLGRQDLLSTVARSAPRRMERTPGARQADPGTG